MKHIFNIFWNAPGARPISVSMCMLFASFADLVSMGALVPLAAQLANNDGGSTSFFGKATVAFFSFFGLQSTFTNLLLFVGFALVSKSVIAFLAMRFVAISVADITTKLRSKLLASMMNARWAYFVDHRPGEVSTMISAQSAMAGDAYLSSAQLIITTISGFSLLFTAFLVSGKLVIFCLVAALALAFPLYYILKLAEEASKKQWETSNDLSSGVQDVLSNMKPLKSMARQTYFLESFATGIRTLRLALILMVVSRHAIYHGQDILSAIMVVAGVYVGVVVLQTPMSEMLVVGIIFYQVVDVIKRIQLHLQGATIASAAYMSLMQTITNAEHQLEHDYGKIDPKLEDAIKFEHVSFAYGENKVLKDVNLECPVGNITVLIGPSGAGKTTIMDLIIGFYLPISGRVLIDNTPMVDIQLSKWRQKIGYVPQELTLLRGSVFDNITLGDLNISEEQVIESLRLAGALGFVEAMPNGMHTDIGTMGAKLSGGQRQRISLARALVLKPKLLLLDEVTSALDEATESEICENITQLAGQFTIVSITHKPAWKAIAKRLYRVTDGQVELVSQDAELESTAA
jgi:ATP-binding cassette, subfamily C, bacterial